MKNKSRVLIVALIVVLLALAIAYASFSGVLNISGKANASGNFEVVFTNGVVSTSEHGTAVVTATDATKMTADIKLSYPGDGCYVTATIKNNGTVPALYSPGHSEDGKQAHPASLSQICKENLRLYQLCRREL